MDFGEGKQKPKFDSFFITELKEKSKLKKKTLVIIIRGKDDLNDN